MKKDPMKSWVLFALTALTALSSGILACGSSAYNLSNPPSGFVFTDSNGNILSTAQKNSSVQLRNSYTQEPLLQFTISGDVDFQNVIADRNLNNTLVHFPSASDKAGIAGVVTLFTPCNPAQNTVRICPAAATISEIAPSCDEQILLTSVEPTSGNYTWINSTRGAVSDCQIQADISNFNTGGGGSILFPYYFTFLPPEGYAGSPVDCSLQCDDPIIQLGGVELAYQMNDPVVPSSTSSLEGYNITGTEQMSADLDPNFITANLDPLPTFIWTFVDASNVTLDLYSYNFLLEGENTPLPRCVFQCEMFPDGQGGFTSGTFDFNLNGESQIAYTVSGFSANTAYFISPAATSLLLSVQGGVVGISTLVITSTFSDDPIYPLDFTLGEGDFSTVSGFEVLDLNNGIENTVTLNQASLLAFSNTTATLQILGTDLDTVILSDAPWTQSGPVTLNGNTFTEYQNGTATLFVQEGVNVD